MSAPRALDLVVPSTSRLGELRGEAGKDRACVARISRCNYGSAEVKQFWADMQTTSIVDVWPRNDE